MTTKQEYSICNNWDTDLCPHRGNELMKKTVPGRPITYLDSKDQEELDRLCMECPEFVLDPRRKKDYS